MSNNPQGKRPASKGKRWAIGLLIAFVVYSVIGFLVAPPALKWQLEKQLPGITKRSAAVRQVRVNPWALSLAIRGLTLKEPGGEFFAGWEEFYANFQISSLFRWAWTFREIRLVEPRGAVILQKDGTLNFANMFEAKPEAEAEGSGELPRANVFLLTVTNGFVSAEDHTRSSPFRTEYRPINLVLTDLTTRPGTGTPYSLRAESDASKSLEWAGDITLQPFSSRGKIAIENAEPKKYQPYLEDFTRAQVMDGRVTLRTDYFVAAGTNSFDLVVTNGFFQLASLKVTDPESQETVLAVPNLTLRRVRVNFREREAGIGALEIRETELLTRLNKDGRVNLLNLLVASEKTNAPAAAAPGSEPWTVSLDDFQFTKGTVTFEDLTRPTAFQSRLHPIELSVTNLTTRTNSVGGFKFAVRTEASEHLGGEGNLSINPVTSGGEVFIENLELTKYRPYLEPFFRGEIASGKFNANVPFQVALSADGWSAIISNAPARIENLKVLSPGGGETVVSVPQLAIEGTQANLVDRSAKVALVRTSGGSILARRQKNGELNLMELLPPAPAETGTAEPAPAAETKTTNTAWAATIDEIAVEDYSIRLEDLGPTTASLTEVDQFKLNLKGVSMTVKEPIAAQLALRINGSGLVRADGLMGLDPLSTVMNVSVTNLDLQALQPYLQDHARLQLSGGTFNLSTQAKWEALENSSGKLLAEGGFSIVQFNTHDLSSNPLVGWTNLTVEGFKIEMPPERLHIESIRWDGLSANLVIRSNKQANLGEIMIASTNVPVAVKDGDAVASVKEDAKAKTPFPVTVGVFAITNATVRFADASIQPASGLEIQEFGGTITGLSSDSNGTADVNLGGSFGEQAPFTIVGKINPLAAEPRLDLTISNRNMQLAPLTPYMEKFAGHPLNKGRLSLALRYAISGQELNAENHVQIDQLTLGPRNSSPDATKLPVKLAIALLKDSSGKIDLDVPVKGRLDDPEFRVGPIILKVVMNMITKAAASPFKLLGAAVGGGEELSYLEFRPGTAELVEGETNKIGKLIKALAERELNVEIDSSIDPVRDRDALARQLVHGKIKQLRLQELEEMGQKPVTPESFEIEPVENQRLLRAAVVEQFGTNVTVALQEMLAKAPDSANESAEGGAAEVREVKWYEILKVPFQKKNSPEAIARRQAKADAELLEKNPALGTLTPPTMVKLLASKTEVTPDHFLKLMQERGQAANSQLLTAGLSQDRVLLVAPKPVADGFSGEARVNLSVN